MFKRSFMIATLLLASTAVANNDLSQLNNFNSAKASPEFEQKLKEDSSTFTFFLNNPAALKKVLNDASLQNQLLAGAISLSSLILSAPEFTEDTPRLQPITPGLNQDTALEQAQRDLSRVPASSSTEEVQRDLRSATDTSKPAQTDPRTDLAASSPSSTPVASPLDELFNINILPESGRDALGWPSYLKVPASCAAPVAGVIYRHDAEHFVKTGGPDGTRIIPPRAFELPNGDSREVGHFLGPQLGASRSVSLSEREVIALPFITAVSDASGVVGGISLDFNVDNVWADVPGARTLRPQVTISECPGDMTGANENGTLPQLGSGLTPGKRYFLNIRYPEGECAATYSIIGAAPILRNGGPVCAFRFSNGEGFTNRPPYTGPCLTRGPYPMNYNSIHCQGSNWFANTPNPDVAIVRNRCFDPRGEVAEMRFEKRLIGGRVSWVQGADKQAHARMICVGSTDGNGSNGSWDAIPVHEVCASHTDGFRRTFIAIQGGGYPLARQVTQCRFDRTKRVFEWQTLATDRLIPDFPLMPTPSTTILSRYVDAQGNEVNGTLRVEGPGHASSIDPRWEDLTRPLSSFRP